MNLPTEILRLLVRERALEAEEWSKLIGYMHQSVFSFQRDLSFQPFGSLRCCRTPESKPLEQLFPSGSISLETGLIPVGLSAYKMSGLFFWTSVTNLMHEPSPSNMETGTLNVWGLTHDQKWILAEISVRRMSVAAQRAGAGGYENVTAITVGATSPLDLAPKVYGNGCYGIVHALDAVIQSAFKRIEQQAELAKQTADDSTQLVRQLDLLTVR